MRLGTQAPTERRETLSAGKSALSGLLRLHHLAAISFQSAAGINCLYYSGAFQVASSAKPEIENLMKCGTQ